VKEDRQNLGRRIADLLEENVRQETASEQVLELDIDQIRPNESQPRTIFDEKALEDLAQSIREHGIVQPVLVKPLSEGYMLVAGERRLRAARQAGRTTIPAIARDYNTRDLPELALIENLQREDLTPIEEALAFQTILRRLGITHEQLASKIGKSRVYVTNMLGLLHLPVTVIESVNHGLVTMGHARALSKIKDHQAVLELHERVIVEQLTVRELESIIRNRTKKRKSSISEHTMQQATKRLSHLLPEGTRYNVSKTQLTIRFDNEEELNRLLELLKGDE
jgi:ParB family chromosome partitioning protein